MPDASPPWRLAVLGPAQLVAPDGRVVLFERKTAALLAYLALEGPTPRRVLSELLWPGTRGPAARNNLVHLLRRLNHAAGAALAAGDPLCLVDDVVADVHAVQADQPDAELPGGPLLDGLDFDDIPALAEWIVAWREHLELRRAAHERRRIQHHAEQGHTAQAAALAERLLTMEPVAEDVARTLMRLHYQLGDRPAALRTYHRLKAALARELGTGPSPETAQVARSIEGEEHPGPQGHTGRVPLSVLRPPTLLGREREWSRLDTAWTAGKMVYVTGPPGIGKTRFVQDFARSKGRVLYLPAVPGAQDLPYWGAARNARARLAAAPDVTLPDWAQHQLSRVLPGWQGRGAPIPFQAPEDRLQFFSAYMQLLHVTSAGIDTVIADDTQYYDQATVELGTYMLSRAPLGTRDGVARHISIFRQGELTPAAQATVDHLVGSGVAVLIELGALPDAALGELLGDLDVPDAARVAGALGRLTGGNPQFVLEAVRQMHQRGTFAVDALLSDPPASVTALIEQRLARLPEDALQAARAAAVLRSGFTVELVAEVLGVPPLALIQTWDHLEAAQVMTGERFTHDLVLEAVLGHMPPRVQQVLHRASARVLGRQHAPAARIAWHWQHSGDLTQAAPWLLRAGEAAEHTLRVDEARAHYQAARDAYAQQADTAGTARAEAALQALSARVLAADRPT